MARSEFTMHLLNPEGIAKARLIAEVMTDTLNRLEELCGTSSREMAIVRTKMEEAAFFAKKAMAVNPNNQES